MRALAAKRLHFCTILCLAFFFFFFLPSLSISTDTIASNQSLTDDQTLVSTNDMFELGFFTPGSSQKWYLGIWYKNTPDRTVVWVANRDDPLANSTGAAFKIGADGNIVVLDQVGNLSWFSNQTKSATNPVVQLLGTGNLVLREENDDDPENYPWQSFDHPTDTLLPDMKLGWDLNRGLDRHLTSWKSADDPGTGDFSFKLDFHGSPELFIWKQDVQDYRSGPWNGIAFSGIPEMRSSGDISFNFVFDQSDVYHSFTIRDKSIKLRMIVNSSGLLQRFIFMEDGQFWNLFWYAPKDQCDSYRECGPYGICNTNVWPVCKCTKGFEPKNQRAWELRDGSDGCVRTTSLNCTTDGFLAVKGIKLPESKSAVVEKGMSLKECREACLKNCSCTAYASFDISDGGSGTGCVMWTGDLLDMRLYADGRQDLFVRLAASDLDKRKDNKIIITIAVITGTITIFICAYMAWKCLAKRKDKYMLGGSMQRLKQDKYKLGGNMSQVKIQELPMFNFEKLEAATNYFHMGNKIGKGGFGEVYKGKLQDGQEIAVKRLLNSSGQGVEEFMTEVEVISKLQHRNLVRLLGCCAEGEEKMLIYEYMPSGSLSTILFDPQKRGLLDWKKRFNIIEGIGRGLLYLHRDSRLRIIHRDIKASNILLDEALDPKISDFGTARIFAANEDKADTKRIIGTYGYMSPEYAMEGRFSEKSDLFSFGVLLLEIVSGRKNTSFYHGDEQSLSLLGLAWKFWNEDNISDLVDPMICNRIFETEISRCIHVGLLCVQEFAKDRPTVSTALSMLNSEIADLPTPKQPAFTEAGNMAAAGTESSQQHHEKCSTGGITATTMEGR